MNNKLSYLTARAPKSNVQFRLCLRENKRYNGSHLQFHDCQVSSFITQRYCIYNPGIPISWYLSMFYESLCLYVLYIPYFSLPHQYKLSELLGFCKTPKNVGYIFSASGGSLNTCRLLHKMLKILFESLNTTWPRAGKGTCPKDKLVFFFFEPCSYFLLFTRKKETYGHRLCNDKEVV